VSGVEGAPPSGFLDITRVLVPRSLAEESNERLREVGRQKCEGFALWTGRRDGQEFLVEETIVPAQTALRSEDGVCVTVDGAELFRLNVHLFETGRTLIAQLHTHPHEAYHSDTDDTYPIATTAGALSLVIPDFAKHAFSLARCAVFRLCPQEGWVELEPAVVDRLIEVVDGC
jgi:hypothetical protein